MKIIDYVDIQPTIDTSWHTVTVPASLSGYAGAIVMFTPSSNLVNANMSGVGVRPTGVSQTWDLAQGANGAQTLMYVPIDGSDQFEITCNRADTLCWLIGGFTDTDAVFFSDDWGGNELILSTYDGTFYNIDISSYLGADTAIAAIIQVDGGLTGNGSFGYGYTDATDDCFPMVSTTRQTFLVPVVGTGEVRISCEFADITPYIVGYIKSGISLNPTRTAIATAGGAIETKTVPDITTEDIVVIRVGRNNGGSGYGGAREVGSTIVIDRDKNQAAQVPLRVDASDQVQTWTSTSIVDVYPEWFATNDADTPTYTITSIDGDNDVQAGQTNVDIIMTATTGVTVSTLGGESLTINGVS